jgi:hypothetical protein
MAYIDTPRTEAGNATFLDRGNGIDDLSMEMSFHSPKKRQGDLVAQMRGKTNSNLRTPGARNALSNRPNFTKQRNSGEITPLLKSVTKKNFSRGKENGVAPRTPGGLRSIYEDESPGLQTVDNSAVVGSDTESDTGVHAGATSLPNAVDSSGLSTPIATLPSGNGDRILEDKRSLMTLREQENASKL